MRRAIVGLTITLAAAGIAREGAMSAAASQRPTFRSEVQLVVVRVTVVDADDRPLTGLTEDDFIVLENGAPQPVVHFLSSEVPLDVAVLLDTSTSVKPILPKIQATATAFLTHLRPGDRGMVATFADRTAVVANLTDDQTRLREAIAGLRARGHTRLFDGLYVTLGTLLSASRDAARRQALVVLTDGRDTASNLGLADVRRQAITAGVPLYPVFIADMHSDETTRFETTLKLFDIIELARETGGRVFRAAEAPTEHDTRIEQAYAAIARELSAQYVLAYVPRVHHSGVPSGIEVQIPSQPDAVASARAGHTNRSRDGPAAAP